MRGLGPDKSTEAKRTAVTEASVSVTWQLSQLVEFSGLTSLSLANCRRTQISGTFMPLGRLQKADLAGIRIRACGYCAL